ncbi:MAG: hypothetical protein GX907_02220 [Clostridiaceae bacterium]|nr:hypothetical protein [Clostridiaceae bacterium]
MAIGGYRIGTEQLFLLNSLQLFYGLLLAAAVEDRRSLSISNIWFVLICAFSVLQAVFLSAEVWEFAYRILFRAASGLLAAAPLLGLYMARLPVGGGDLKIVFAWGFCTSWQAAYAAVFFGICLKIICTVGEAVLAAVRSQNSRLSLFRSRAHRHFPLVPWLCCGVLFSAFLPLTRNFLMA